MDHKQIGFALVYWIQSAQVRAQRRALVTKMMNIQILLKAGNLLSS